MKIIAALTQEDYGKRFLVEMSENEIAKLAGEPYASSLPCDQRPAIGRSYNIDKAWEDLHAFRGAAKRIEGAAETLRACASLVTTAGAAYIIPILEAPAV